MAEEQAPQAVDRVSIRIPPFWKAEPDLWFIQIEAQFENNHITRDTTKYNQVLEAVDTEILKQVADFIRSPPDNNKYTALKERLINTYADSEEKKLRKLLSDITLGDKTPTQLLNEMTLLNGNKVSNQVLRTLWLQHLPPQVQAVLTTCTDGNDNLAKMADKIMEIEQPRNYAMSRHGHSSDVMELLKKLSDKVDRMERAHQSRQRNRSSSRSRSRTPTPNPNNSETNEQWCWYHNKFQQKARKCNPPCNFAGNGSPRQ